MNTKAISFASMLFIGGYIAWSLSRDLGAPLKLESYKRAWQAGVLALVVSVATDLHPDLGAAFGALIVVGFTLEKTAKGETVFQKPATPPKPSSPSSSGGSGSGSSGGKDPKKKDVPWKPLPGECPPGQHWDGTRCLPGGIL